MPTHIAHAQRSVAEELRLNLHAGTLRQGTESALETGISAGYGSSRWFVPFLTYDRATLSDDSLDFTLRHLDAGIRVHVRGAQHRIVPFAIVALTWRTARYEDRPFLGDTMDVKLTGTGPTVGAGVLYYMLPRLALEASAKWTGGRLDKATVRGSVIDAGTAALHDSALRVNVGISWFPLRARPAGR